MRLAAALILCLALAAASARPSINTQSEQLLRDSLAQMRAGRRLNQLPPSSAVSRATGGTSATARAVAGPGVASTEQAATGPGSQVAGVSQVGAKVDACVRGPASAAACKTLTTEERSLQCTDIAPPAVDGAEQFTCTQQVGFNKCDSDFIYLGAFCLASCGRCGDACKDTTPTPEFQCALAVCNTTEVVRGPYCLKTCGRCSTASPPTSTGTGGAGGAEGTGTGSTSSTSATAVSGGTAVPSLPDGGK